MVSTEGTLSGTVAPIVATFWGFTIFLTWSIWHDKSCTYGFPCQSGPDSKLTERGIPD